MAHILQTEGYKVTELYLADGNISESKYILAIFKDGTLSLTWCLGDAIQDEVNPTLARIGKGMKIEFGEPNLFGTRQILAFQDEQGNLDKKWTKIL